MYNQDLEGKRPGIVDRFTAEVAGVPALLFVSPEHNRSLPALPVDAIARAIGLACRPHTRDPHHSRFRWRDS